MDDTPLYTRFAAAYVRGKLAHMPDVDRALFDSPLDTLDDAQLAALITLGRSCELRLHRFKRTMGLPRVAKVLGVLKGIAPAELLDIGSGRGAFLWPLLDAFPSLPITALDRLDYRVADIQAVAEGGVVNLRALHADVRQLPFDDRPFDVVTLLEVLEHIPETARTLAEVCRVARRFVLLSVPAKPDDNPEHIHRFDAATLERLLYGKHSIFYTDLPHYLLEFDLYDTHDDLFLSTERRHTMLHAAPFVASVHVLYGGLLPSLAALTALIGPSVSIAPDQREQLGAAALTHGLDPDQALRESDLSGLMEGLYIKVEEGGAVTAPYKFVRPGFLQAVRDSGSHWMDRPLLPNRLRADASLW